MKKGFSVSKKGQTSIEIPFQMIFSIILIAIFLYTAFTGIRYFMESADQARILQFSAEVEAKVNTIWQALDAEQTYTFSLPNRIEKVCFGDLSTRISQDTCPDFEIYREQAKIRGSNMFFCPPTGAYSVGAPVHLKIDCDGNDCLRTEQFVGTYCVENDDGKVSITLRKEFGSTEVVLS